MPAPPIFGSRQIALGICQCHKETHFTCPNFKRSSTPSSSTWSLSRLEIKTFCVHSKIECRPTRASFSQNLTTNFKNKHGSIFFPVFFSKKKQIWERDSFHNMKKALSEGLGELTHSNSKASYVLTAAPIQQCGKNNVIINGLV